MESFDNNKTGFADLAQELQDMIYEYAAEDDQLLLDHATGKVLSNSNMLLVNKPVSKAYEKVVKRIDRASIKLHHVTLDVDLASPPTAPPVLPDTEDLFLHICVDGSIFETDTTERDLIKNPMRSVESGADRALDSVMHRVAAAVRHLQNLRRIIVYIDVLEIDAQLIDAELFQTATRRLSMALANSNVEEDEIFMTGKPTHAEYQPAGDLQGKVENEPEWLEKSYAALKKFEDHMRVAQKLKKIEEGDGVDEEQSENGDGIEQ